MTPAVEDSVQLERMQKRLERERRARAEAERIAESSTRDLYEHQRRLELMRQVAEAANLADSVEEAIGAALDAVRGYAGWALGHAFVLDPGTGELVSSGIWSADSESVFAEFRRETEASGFEPGRGLPGRVLREGRPICIRDVREDETFVRIGKDDDAGLRGAFAFPAITGSTVFGVLEFFSAAPAVPEDELVELLLPLGEQLGRALERERIRQVQIELDEHVRSLEEANEELKEFAYVASHDLSEPLRTISGFVQLLQSRYEGKLDEDADEFIGFVVQGAERMQRLIEDLLIYSRVGRSQLAPAEVEVEALLERVQQGMSRIISETDTEVVVAEMPVVRADPAQLERLLANLISNAIKFAAANRPPRVEVTAVRDEGEGAWVFTVADNGIGIEPRHAERIFRVFQRLHSVDEYEGTGIGLSICKKIIERHGGRVWAEPAAGGGTQFHFTLPDSEAPGVQPTTEPEGTR